MNTKFMVRVPDEQGLLVHRRGLIIPTSSDEYMVVVKIGKTQVKVGNIFGRPWRNLFGHNTLRMLSPRGERWNATTAREGFREAARTLAIKHFEHEVLLNRFDLDDSVLRRLTFTISRDNIERVVSERMRRSYIAGHESSKQEGRL